MEYVGKRIRLIRMDDSNCHDPCVVPSMTTGTVVSVDDAAARKILRDYFINRYNRKKSEADLELERANCVVVDPFHNKPAANRG